MALAGLAARHAVPALSDREEQVFRKVAWRLLPTLCLCYLVAYIDRVNVGFAKLTMLQDLRMSEASYGLGAGLFFVGYILFELPSNVMLEKVGARLWIARIMISWGVISGLFTVVSQPWQFYALRVLLGAAEAGLLPGVMFFLGSWFPSYRRGRIMSLFFLGSPLSGVIGGPLSGWILHHFDHVGGLAGWRWMFLMEAVPTVLVGILVLLSLPNRPDESRWLAADEKALVEGVLSSDGTTSHRHRFLDGLRDWKVWALGYLDFALLISVYAIFFWLPSFIRMAGVHDIVTIGWLTVVPNIGAVAGLLLGGWSSDRFRERRWHLIVPFLLAAASLAASTLYTGNVAATVALFTVAYSLCFAGFPVIFSMPANFLQGPAAAAGLAVVCSVANISGLVSNWLIGRTLTLTGNDSVAMYLFAGFLIVGAAVTYALPSRAVDR